MPTHFLGTDLRLGILFWLGLTQFLQWQPNWQRHSPGSRQHRRVTAKSPLPYPGLLAKPHCAACAQEALHGSPSLPEPPPLMPRQRGRPNSMDTHAHDCPRPSCRYYGWVARGNVRANGHPSGRRWRQLYGRACAHDFLETHSTLFYRKTPSAEVILHALATLAEGLGIRAVGRAFDVEPNTILAWLSEAAEHIEAVSRFLLHGLQVPQVQLDELFALVSEFGTGQISASDVIERLPWRPRRVWTAIDPVRK